MKKLLLLTCALMLLLFAQGQSGDAANISAAEYFIDTDPGVGQGIAIPVIGGAVTSFSANVPAGTAPGFHFLAIRTKDATGRWGLYENRGFFVSDAAATDVPNIVAAEYFIDTDPGVGSGLPIAVSNGAIVNFTASVPAGTVAGFHFIGIRTKDATGKWGLYENRGFFVSDAAVTDVPNIVAAEYFIDTDPGAGSGSPITVVNGAIVNFTANIPAGTVAGFHFLAIRTKDATGKWGLYENRGFYVSESTATDAANIVAAEYFVDADPGNGLGTPIAVTNGAVTSFTATVPAGTVAGFHFLAIRTKDATGKWGLYENRGFYVIESTATDAANIVAAEYFVDADPGQGLGTPIAVTNGAVTSFTATVPAGTVAGFHFLAIRTKDATGKWGLYENRGFYVANTTANAANIVAAEYFLDVDPGPGKGTPIALPTPGATINETLALPLDFNLPQGHHEFSLRVKDATGNWGLYARDTFFIPFVTVPKVFIGTVPANLCAGATLNVPYTVNIPFGTVNQFTAQLSNAGGSFASPVNIGTITSDTTGVIAAIIPANTPVGNGYRVRIVASEPKDTSNLNANTITIGRVPEVGYSINGISATCAGNQTYTVSPTEPGVTYTWSVSSGGTITPNGSSATINWTTAGLHTISVFATNSCGNGTTKTLDVRVFASTPTLTPSIIISNRSLTATAATLAQGVLAFVWFKDGIVISGQTGQSYTVPNADSGSYTVAYTNTCGTGNQSLPVNISFAKNDQTITFSAVSAKVFGDAPFVVNAVATSGLPVSYVLVSGPASLVGNTVTITGAGTILIQATQAGNTQFNPATAELSVAVSKAAATITLSNLSQVFDGAGKAAVATTNPLGLNNSITYNSNPELPVNAGSYNVSAVITSPNYQGSTNGILNISKANQNISLNNPGSKSYNDVPFLISATATSGLPVSFSLQTVPATGVATINGNQITLLGAGGTVTISANQTGNTNFNAAPTATTIFAVRPPEGKDVQVIALVAPTNGCGLGVSVPITLRIRNTGTQAATGFPVSYRIGQDIPVTETFTGTIASGANADFTFATKGIFAQTAVNYPVTLYTALAGDEKLNNDTLISAVARIAPANMYLSADTTICAGGTATLRSFGAGTTQWTGGPTGNSFVVSPAITTTYTAQLTDINNCTTQTLSTTVTVNPIPVVNAGADVSILKGSSTTLLATGAQTYQWNNGVTTAANLVSPNSTTEYSVIGTTAQGCKANDAVKVTVNFSAISVSPGVLQFDNVVVDSTKTLGVTITNTGTLAENITGIAGLSAPFTTSFIAPVSLPAGASIVVPVKFAPTATIIYQGAMAISTSAGNFDITLRGNGVPPSPAWTVTPASFNFGKVARNTNVTQNLVIRNTGNIAIRITSVSSSSTRFTGTTNGILDIPVGGSVNLAVRFNPLAITAYTGSITVRSANASLPLLRPIVSGVGFIPGNPPQLEFVVRPPYDGKGGVTPLVGQPGNYTYSIIYKHPNGVAPMAGFPKVGIDKNKDEDFSDAGEGQFSLVKEGTSTNWTAGVTYSFTTYLPVSELYGYQFFATDANNNDAFLTEYKAGPVVTREVLDLHIYASDIKFSKPNPAVNENFTVTATIHNNSPYAVAEVPLRFYYKDSLFLLHDTIPFIDGKSQASVTHTLNFSPDGFYPIKVWIDSSNTLKEGNLLNNYASRPVIIGDFTVPGTIDLVSNATPSGCTKGRITFSGRANYRGLNLAGTPPVEGAEVTINIPNYETGRVLKTTTDINGNWYIFDDPCAQDINPEDCSGYLCGVTYNYTVEVTDFTLTSPVFSSSVTRPCVPCSTSAKLQNAVSVSGCILPETPYSINTGIANFEYDINNQKICAPPVYNDTITVYIDGQLMTTYTLDSIIACGSANFTYNAPGLPQGMHQVSMNHIYYFANGERIDQSVADDFTVLPYITDIKMVNGLNKTGHKSFTFSEMNITCGVPAGAHKLFLYDSVSGYAEKLLMDSFFVANLAPFAVANFAYGNPNWQVGNHYITIITDVEQIIPELREDNNILKAVFYVQEPDIVLSGIKISNSAAAAGTLINFSTKVFNTGSPINQPFKVQFRVNGALLGTKINVLALGTNDTVTLVSAPFTVPVSLCPVEITAMADVDLEIQEVSEKNNFDTTKFGVNIKAGRNCINETEETTGAGFFDEDDALGTISCFPYVAPKGVITYLATTVRNTGTRDVRNIRVQFKLNSEELGTDVIPLLKAGQKTESGFYYAFDTVGRFIVNAFADYTREICELDEKDNVGNIHVDIKRSVPDLEILSQYIAPSNLNPLPNQNITIVSSVVNIGDGPSTPTKMRFWVDDVQLGVDIPIDSLYPGQDTTVKATLSYASAIVGPKIIKVRADVDNVILERKKGNNEATRAIILGAAPDFARSKREAITLVPSVFGIGDEITIRNYVRNYGGEGGAAWIRFYYRNTAGEKILIDSVRFGMESNDSSRIGLKWKVAQNTGQIITEIAGALPLEFNELNNIDSLRFDAALPVTLLSLTGSIKNDNALLQWLTTSEINLLQFDLERSTDGASFEKIATVKANNTSGQHSYQYTDAAFNTQPTPSVYYRLRLVDKDGQYRYSAVVRIGRTANTGIVKMYPNPVKYSLQVQLQSAVQGTFVLSVLDASGKLALRKQYGITPGIQTLTLPVQMLPQGWYVLLLQQPDGSTKEMRFIKE